MATFPESTVQGFPPDGNPSPFPSFRNVSAPYMATLSLPGLTIGLPMWLFSTSVVPSVMTPVPPSPSFEPRHVDSKVEPTPSSPVSSSSSPPSPGESFTSSNQETKKKKKKMMKKKKSDKHETTYAATAPSTSQVRTPSSPPRKVKFPCKLCKGDHLLCDCLGILRILEVWSHDLAHPSSSSEAHGDATLSNGNSKKKGKIRFPCRLCEGNHPLHLCPLMDKASAVLGSLTASSPQLPVGYQRLSSDPLSIEKEIDLDSSLVCPSPSELGYAKPVPDQPLVRESFNLGSPPVDHSVLE